MVFLLISLETILRMIMLLGVVQVKVSSQVQVWCLLWAPTGWSERCQRRPGLKVKMLCGVNSWMRQTAGSRFGESVLCSLHLVQDSSRKCRERCWHWIGPVQPWSLNDCMCFPAPACAFVPLMALFVLPCSPTYRLPLTFLQPSPSVSLYTHSL